MSLTLFCGLLGYLSGSIPAAYLLVRWRKGIDIRRAGSRNVGAMNSFVVTRSRWIGLAVLVFDALKGLLPVLLASAVSAGSFFAAGAAAIGAVAGHNYPVWLGGKGGRGLATAAGAMLAIAPLLVLLWCGLWWIGYAFVREINVANAIACVATPLVLLAVPAHVMGSLVLMPVRPAYLYLFLVILFVAILSRLVTPVLEFIRGNPGP